MACDRFGLTLSRAMSVPESERGSAAQGDRPGAEAVRLAPARRGGRDPAAPRRLHDRHAGGVRELAGAPSPPASRRSATSASTPPSSCPAARTTSRSPRRRSARSACWRRAASAAGSCTPTSRTASRCRSPTTAATSAGRRSRCTSSRGCCGARLAHSYGGLIDVPWHRAAIHFALDDLHGRDSIGSMVYGNTVDMRPRDRAHNLAVLSTYLLVDIACQLRRPTGHAVHPVPLTRGRARPERRRERRGAGDRARARARGAAVGRPVRLAPAGAARRRPGRVRRAVPRPRARLPARRRRRHHRPGAGAARDAAARHGRPRAARRPDAAGRDRPARAVEGRADVAASAHASTAPCRGSTACASCSPCSTCTTSSATRSRSRCRGRAAR